MISTPATSTRGESLSSLLGEKGSNKTNETKELPFIKNVGFVNEKWTEILVDNESESQEMDRDEIKKAIIQMSKREEHNPLDNWTDRFIRVNHKTYIPVEVAKDRNGRTMYTPLIPTEKPRISFGAEIRTPSESDSENRESTSEEIIEVEYPRIRRKVEKVLNPNVKVRLDVEIINNKAVHNSKCNKQHQVYRSCLTKQELVNLINEEIKLEKEQSINLVEIIDKASLNEYTKATEEDDTNDWEKKAEKIRSEIKRICIEIESKGLAECRQTDITSHEIKMKDNKPIKHKVRPVPYHCRKDSSRSSRISSQPESSAQAIHQPVHRLIWY